MPTLDGPDKGEKVFTVSEITAAIKDLVEGEFPYVWIVGEISNRKLHSSGHAYFTLKDDSAQIACALFRSARQLTATPEDGLKVFAQGRIGVYEKQGQYQLIVSTLLPVGKGDLAAAFNELKTRLEKEGLFDLAAKRPLPRFPSRLGVVTSPTGAAVRDVIRVARRVYAGVEIVVNPVRVQGEGAAGEIARAVEDFNRAGGVDVIILARGGGSIEDLWAFNEEIVARAIRASRIPVVSAVGHEIDFTIADFAADLRAPTPSAAPGLVLADYADIKTRLGSLAARAEGALAGRFRRYKEFLAGLATRYGLRRIGDRIVESRRSLDESLALAERLTRGRVEAGRVGLASLAGRLDALNPLATLKRGYSVCYKGETREIVSSCRQVGPGDRMRVVFAEGGAVCAVEKVEAERKYGRAGRRSKETR
ncbi:MAG: exodeoxyribonuclease VII large subunit [bacterium]